MRSEAGYLLIFASIGSLLAVIYFSTLIKLLPEPEHPILKAAYADTRYGIVVPVTLPVFVIAVYLNWFAINLYKSS
jgi:phosphatidylinositol glycan anchor class Y biosynthesis protein